MATVNYTLRIDESDKRNAERIFKELGMTFSTGINIYLKTVSRQKRIPFDLATNYRYDVSADTSATASLVSEKENAYMALDGLLAGHDVDFDIEKAKRILSK